MKTILNKINHLCYNNHNLKATRFTGRINSILFSIIISINCFTAQNSKQNTIQSIGLETYSTGNGHGTFFSPYLGLNKGSNAFYVGPVIQKKSQELRGFKLGYTRTLTGDSTFKSGSGDKDILQLNFSTSIQYTNKLCLSDATLNYEKLKWGDTKKDLDNIRLSTGEVKLGFELQINITNQISWKNYAGASVYYNFNYTEILIHQRSALTLNLGTSICFFFNKASSQSTRKFQNL